MELVYKDRQFLLLEFTKKTPKNIRFAMENTSKETAYNLKQLPLLDFNPQITKKHAFCKRKR